MAAYPPLPCRFAELSYGSCFRKSTRRLKQSCTVWASPSMSTEYDTSVYIHQLNVHMHFDNQIHCLLEREREYDRRVGSERDHFKTSAPTPVSCEEG